MNENDIRLLDTRISIIMVRENYTFLNTISDFKVKLYEYFKVYYSEDLIESCLNRLQEAHLANEYEQQQQHIIEIEEDFIEGQ